MSAIDFDMEIERLPNLRGDRVKITMSGKFLPYKYYGNEAGILDYGVVITQGAGAGTQASSARRRERVRGGSIGAVVGLAMKQVRRRRGVATGNQHAISSGGQLKAPADIATEANGQILVADMAGDKLIRIDPKTGDQSVVAQGGLLTGIRSVEVFGGEASIC
jgi:hypothetical protein